MPYFDFNHDERKALNRIGATSGCHSCGTKNPGTLSGNWIADVQPPSAVNWGKRQQRIHPHCLDCKQKQGLAIREFVFRNGRAPWTGLDVLYCVVFISDARCRDAPNEKDFIGGIFRSDNCLALGCVSYMDNTVQVIFGKPNDTDLNVQSVYAGLMDTPSRWLAVFTADHDMVSGLPVVAARTRVEVWRNHPVEPDTIFISVD